MANYRKYPVRVAIKLNEKETCKIKGCDRHRHSLCGYCQYHWQRWRETGHPEGKVRYKGFFKDAIDEAAEIIRINRNTFVIGEAIGFLDRLLFRGHPRLNRVANRYVRHLKEKGADPVDLLAMISGIGMMHFRHHTPFHDENEMKINIATKFIRFFPRTGLAHIQITAMRQIGNLLWDRLGATTLRIRDAADKRDREIQKRRELLRIPLKSFD